jgi:hypothetical protein
MQLRRLSIRQWIQVPGRWKADLSAEPMPGPRQPTRSPFKKPTEWPPEFGLKEEEPLRDRRQTGDQRRIVSREETHW